ncbi:MAG: (deoxy)nucleoside triphosphate pyrophosphohydrolase [Opitutaceae bacterium]
MTQAAPIPVVAAVVCRGDLYLAAQRPAHKHLGLRWEFPGGKVEAGETPEAALIREIREELGCEIIVGQNLPKSVHAYGAFSIEMIPFLAFLKPGTSEPHPHEHIAVKWLTLNELQTLDLAAADLPIVNWLEKRQ